MELKRIFLNKNMMLFLGIIFFMNIGFYLKDTSAGLQNENLTFFETADIFKEAANPYLGKEVNEYLYQTVLTDIEEFEHSIESAGLSNERNKEIVKLSALYMALDQMDYILTYPQYLEDMEARADEYSQISIFNKEGSFSVHNIEKTGKDFAVLSEAELSFGNDLTVISVLQFKMIHYLLIVFVFILVLSFFHERKKGLWTLIYATSNGRKNLTIRRLVVLFMAILSVNAILYGSLFILSFSGFGTMADFARSVQSISVFKEFTFLCPVWLFILIYILLNSICCFMLGVVIWLILMIFRNRNLAFGILGIIFGIEYLLYHLLSIQSNFNILKFINLMYYIDPTDIIIGYQNLNLFERAINTNSLFFICLGFICLIGIFALIICTAKSYPVYVPSKFVQFIENMIRKLILLYRKATEHLSITGAEIYKILFPQKGVLILIIYVYIVISNAGFPNLYTTSAEKYIDEFYVNYGGPVTEKTYQYVEELNDLLESVEKEFLDVKDSYHNNDITAREYEAASYKYEGYESIRTALAHIESSISYIEETKQQKGIDVWLVNPKGYDRLIGESSYTTQTTAAIELVFCLVLLCSGVFAFETQSSTKPLLRIASKGRKWLFKRKMISISCLVTFIFVVVYGMQIYHVNKSFGISALFAPIQSLPTFSEFPLRLSLIQFLAMIYIIRLLLLLSCTCIVANISTKLPSEWCMFVSTLILVVPSLLSELGIDIFSYLSVSKYIALDEYMISQGSSYAWIIPITVLIIIGFACLLFANKSWSKTTEVSK